MLPMVSFFFSTFKTLDFSMPFVFAMALMYFLISFSIQIAFFLSKSAPSSSSWFVYVIIECKIQNTEEMDITDTTHSLLLISEELMQQDTLRKTRAATVTILMLTSDRGMNSKSADLLSW